MIVTLDDGTQIAGLFGERSLAASDLGNKDIFIEELYNLEGDVWSARPAKQGIMISGKSIGHIEFMPSRLENENVDKAYPPSCPTSQADNRGLSNSPKQRGAYERLPAGLQPQTNPAFGWIGGKAAQVVIWCGWESPAISE